MSAAVLSSIRPAFFAAESHARLVDLTNNLKDLNALFDNPEDFRKFFYAVFHSPASENFDPREYLVEVAEKVHSKEYMTRNPRESLWHYFNTIRYFNDEQKLGIISSPVCLYRNGGGLSREILQVYKGLPKDLQEQYLSHPEAYENLTFDMGVRDYPKPDRKSMRSTIAGFMRQHTP